MKPISNETEIKTLKNESSILPDGGGETTRSPKLTESEVSSNLKVAAFHTKSYFSLTCSSKDLDIVGLRRLVGLPIPVFQRYVENCRV